MTVMDEEISGSEFGTRAAPLWSSYRTDPVKFVKDVWPEYKLAPYQCEILESLVDARETLVHSANEMGKSFIAALAVLWWATTRPAKVITTSPTEKQLANVLWSEIDHHRLNAKIPLGLIPTYLKLSYPHDKRLYVIGSVASKEGLQGHHLPHLADGTPTVFFVIEEASSRELDELYPIIDTQRHHSLVIGNPRYSSGEFYRRCRLKGLPDPNRPGKLLRRVIRVSADDSPNVAIGKRLAALGKPQRDPIIPGILSYQQYQERLTTWSPLDIRVGLEGQFPGDDESRLFPVGWLDRAEHLGRYMAAWRSRLFARSKDREEARAEQIKFEGPFGLGIDGAAGRDKTVWVVFGRFGVVEIVAHKTRDTSRITTITRDLKKKWKIQWGGIVFDSGGGGKQIADIFRSHGADEVVDVNFGMSAHDSKSYRNRRCEMYGRLQKAMEPQDDIRRLIEKPPEDWSPRNKRKAHFVGMPYTFVPVEMGALERKALGIVSPEEHQNRMDMRQDLAVLPYDRDDGNRLKLPPKDHGGSEGRSKSTTVKAMLGGRSPDFGDALVLSFVGWEEVWSMLGRE